MLTSVSFFHFQPLLITGAFYLDNPSGTQTMSNSKVGKVEESKRKKTGGRTAGTPNKLSSTVKENVIAVFDKLGGVQHMAEWATENPTQFYNIYSKLMPLQVNGAGADGEHLSKVVVEFVSADKG